MAVTQLKKTETQNIVVTGIDRGGVLYEVQDYSLADDGLFLYLYKIKGDVKPSSIINMAGVLSIDIYTPEEYQAILDSAPEEEEEYEVEVEATYGVEGMLGEFQDSLNEVLEHHRCDPASGIMGITRNHVPILSFDFGESDESEM